MGFVLILGGTPCVTADDGALSPSDACSSPAQLRAWIEREQGRTVDLKASCALDGGDGERPSALCAPGSDTIC